MAKRVFKVWVAMNGTEPLSSIMVRTREACCLAIEKAGLPHPGVVRPTRGTLTVPLPPPKRRSKK